MKRGIIIYDSFTGNTRKVAEAIASEGHCEVVKVTEAPLDLRGYCMALLGSPVLKAAPTEALQHYMAKAIFPQKCALFVTYGALLWGPFSAFLCLNAMEKALVKKGSSCLGKFSCPGFHAKFKTYKGRPGEKELRNASAFGKKLCVLADDTA